MSFVFFPCLFCTFTNFISIHEAMQLSCPLICFLKCSPIPSALAHCNGQIYLMNHFDFLSQIYDGASRTSSGSPNDAKYSSRYKDISWTNIFLVPDSDRDKFAEGFISDRRPSPTKICLSEPFCKLGPVVWWP